MYDKFQQLLTERNVTAYKVGQVTGIASSVFSEWKKGKSKPKVDKLKKIADYFEVPIEYFLEG